MHTRPGSLIVLLLAPLFALGAEAPTLKEARQAWLRGRYEESRAAYQTLARDAAHLVPATIGLTRVEQAQGHLKEALTLIDGVLRKFPENADLLARRGEILYLQGRWEDALAAAEKALGLAEDHFPARWVKAQVHRDRGDQKEAETECRWFVRTYTKRNDNDADIKDPDLLLLIGLAGAENARWNRLADQFPFILNEVYGDALKYDKDLWQAELQAGLLLLEKYNRGEALRAFDKALAINPHAAEAWVGKGQAALQKYDLKDADDAVARALEINPNLPEALCLRADVHLASGELEAAFNDLEKARAINPRREATLGRLAACRYLQKQPEEIATLGKAITKFDPSPGTFYFHLAEQLEERRHFAASEKYYQEALRLRPTLVSAQNALGLLYMRMGREDEAKPLLVKAFENDPYNVRVSNMLKVLRHLERYESLKTAHFHLRYDPLLDRELAHYLSDHLEAMYTELAQRFAFEPTGPILIEIFNNHEMFSGRTIALPDLHTIGACTGKVVAMVSPRGKGINKPFNWARVMRHELVHIFNLEQTGYQVPHWFTEGLAVSNEGYPRPAQWTQLLRERLDKGDLLTLDTVNLGFIRPRSPTDWHLAYCQSQLYIEYLTKEHGPEVIGRLLAAFAEGIDVAEALKRVCKVEKPAFEKGYRSYLEQLTAGPGGKPRPKAKTLAQLQKAHAADANDVETAAQLAESYQARKRNAEARKLVDQVLAKEPKHPLASAVKASLLQAGGDDAEARKVLEGAYNPMAPDIKVGQALGRLLFDGGDHDAAEQVFKDLLRAEPGEPKWQTWLLRVATAQANPDKQIAVLQDLVQTDPDDLEQRKRLAGLLLKADRHADAERSARQALEIDVLDEAAVDLLRQALKAQNKKAALDQLNRIFANQERK